MGGVARALRIQFEGAIYHLLARGNARQRIFASDQDRTRFLGFLSQSAERFDVAVQAFVLMPNHFHLLAQTRRENLSRWMHWLMVSYTIYFNWRHGRSGHLFQGRYKSFLVEAGEYLLGLSRYLHLNPVRGSVLGRGTPVERRRRLRDFRWSSYRGYAGLEKPWAFVEETMVLGELGGTRQGTRLRYRRFVEEGLLREIESPFEAVQWQTALGSETFAQQVRDRMHGLQKAGREVTAVRRGVRLSEPRNIIQSVAEKYHLSAAQLLRSGGYGLEARNIAMWMVWERCGMPLREIGELFGGLDYAAVAQRIRRIKIKKGERFLSTMSNV
jgi:putative transposase